MNIVAISADEKSEGAAMAKRYGIWFPLLSDEDLSMAKKYAGLGPSGFARPSIYLLDSEGRVLYRRIGENKADRPTAERLLAIIDEKLALQDMPGAAAFEFPTRVQLAANLGASRVDGETGFLGAADVALMRAMGSRLEFGLEAGISADPDIEARGALLLRLRQPYVRGLAELYAQVPLGLTAGLGDEGAPLRMRTGLSLGNKARLTPESYVFFELAAEILEPIEEEEPSALQAVLRLGYGWAW